MSKKSQVTNLWWFDYFILNKSILKFNYNKKHNVFYLNAKNSYFYYMLLINKNHFTTLILNNLDGVINLENYNNVYYFTLQSFFYDYKFFITLKSKSYFFSTANIYKGNTWLEREAKEHSLINFINLEDSRKLLSNYSYSTDLMYNSYNEIIGDILA